MQRRQALTLCLLGLLACSHAGVRAEGSGSTSASVGQGLKLDAPPTEEAPSGGGAGGALGRKGGPQQRQAVVADNAPLPFCRPGNGVICSDRDYTSFLKAQPANIDLSPDNFAYTGLNPSATVSLSGDTKLDLGGRSFSAAARVGGQGDLKSNVGTEVLNANTDTSNTIAGLAVKGNRLELPLPEKVTVNLDRTESVNSLERRTNKPNFYYILGQNFGLPFGFGLAKDGVFGRRR